MSATQRRLLCIALAISFASVPAFGDDKDLLKAGGGGAPPNLFIVFGNTQTTTQAITFSGTNFSTFDGDADSPGSKLGAAKIVVRQFLADNHTLFNVGMTSFARPPNLGSTSISRKHWVTGLQRPPRPECPTDRFYRRLRERGRPNESPFLRKSHRRGLHQSGWNAGQQR